MNEWAIETTCRECPFRRDVAPGRFPPERFAILMDTARPNFQGFPQKVFACHKTEGKEKACAGFLRVVGFDNITVRLAARQYGFHPDEISALGPLYESYAEMARANGLNLPDDWWKIGRYD